jgi:hypothetical protein
MRSPYLAPLLSYLGSLGLALSLLGGCSSDSAGDEGKGGKGSAGSGPTPNLPAPNGAGNTGNGGSSSTATGGTANGVGATSGTTNGGSSTGGGNSPGGTGPGTGGTPSTAPTGVVVSTYDLAVEGGVVFNVADNYFNDGLVPATPVANFGTHSQIIATPNADGSLDVAWLDYAQGKGRPWAVNAPSAIYLTHVEPGLASATTQASSLNSYKLLGYARDPEGNHYLAYNKDHALKSSTDGDPNRINGNELHVAKVSGGAVAWDQLIFGNQDNKAEASLGDPGGAASGVLGYDPMNQKLVLYVGHSMMWMPVRHQAGFIRLLEPSTGAIVPPSGDDIIHFGAGWWYSHNFNQRLLIDGGNYYMLAHGDAYSRQLGFARWSLNGYTKKNESDFDEPYWTIAGNQGDNKTDSQTGQFVRAADGRFLIVHTTSQTRAARDVRLVYANGSTGAMDGDGVWLTTNQGTTQATMPKLELMGDHVLVTYAQWDSTKKHELTWYAAVLDSALATVAAPHVVPSVEFVDSAPLFRFPAGPNAGKVGWVSGNAAHTLAVHVASLKYD